MWYWGGNIVLGLPLLGPHPSPEDSGVTNVVPFQNTDVFTLVLHYYHTTWWFCNQSAYIQCSMNFIPLTQWAPWSYTIGQYTQGYKRAQQWDICKLLPSFLIRKSTAL